MRHFVLALTLVLFVGCGFPRSKHYVSSRPDLKPGQPLSSALFQWAGTETVPGNRFELVNNGAFFDALHDEIRRAKSSIHVVTFIWRPGKPGDDIAEAIAKRARQGVECRVVVDPLGSIGFGDIRDKLEAAGCDVRMFQTAKITNRVHRKLAIFDGRRAIAGGSCIYRSWMGNGRSKDEWRDTNVQVEGPVVRQIQRAFAENWQEADGGLLPDHAFPVLQPLEGGVKASFVASSPDPDITNAERMTLLVLASAQKRIWISNAYFIPSDAISEIMVEKARQGVDVRVLAAGKVHDWKTVRAAQRSKYARLLDGGVRIFEYQPSMMHAKTIIIDDRVAVVGSTNMDPLSMTKLDEGSLVIEDRALVAKMSRDYVADTEHSFEVRNPAWKRRSLIEKVAPQLTALIGGIL